jgi:hypothetical protein
MLVLFAGVATLASHGRTLGVLVVVAPERADLVLAADVPHRERDVLVLDGLDVEADGGDGRDNLAELELVEDRGLAGGVQADLDEGERQVP